MDMEKFFYRHKTIPVVVKDKNSGRVLNLAFMNRAALEKTIATGEVWYCSRTSEKLWKKGHESAQRLVSIYADCDNDSLLIKVYQTGLVCGHGKNSCFYKRIWPEQHQTGNS